MKLDFKYEHGLIKKFIETLQPHEKDGVYVQREI